MHVELADEGTQDKAYEAIKSAVGKPEAARAAHGYNHPGGPMDCLTAMLKAGVVSRSADGIHMRSPIPTMADYLAQAVEADLMEATVARKNRGTCRRASVYNNGHQSLHVNEPAAPWLLGP